MYQVGMYAQEITVCQRLSSLMRIEQRECIQCFRRRQKRVFWQIKENPKGLNDSGAECLVRVTAPRWEGGANASGPQVGPATSHNLVEADISKLVSEKWT